MAKPKISILVEKLGRERVGGHKVLGLAYKYDKKIRLEFNQKPKSFQNTLIHEVLHMVRPELSEEAITETADTIADILWKCGYRTNNIMKVGKLV